MFAEVLRSGAEHAGRQLVLGKAHARGQDDAEAIEKHGLGGVGLADASQADLAVAYAKGYLAPDIGLVVNGKLDDTSRKNRCYLAVGFAPWLAKK
jgi:hypothetical protein